MPRPPVSTNLRRMTKHFKTFGVIGGGAWGTAIAQMLTREAQDVLIWCREAEVAEAINTRHENTVFLPGVPLNPALKATSEKAQVVTRGSIDHPPTCEAACNILEGSREAFDRRAAVYGIARGP